MGLRQRHGDSRQHPKHCDLGVAFCQGRVHLRSSESLRQSVAKSRYRHRQIDCNIVSPGTRVAVNSVASVEATELGDVCVLPPTRLIRDGRSLLCSVVKREGCMHEKADAKT